MKKLIFLLLVLSAASSLHAYDFKVNGIYYDIRSSSARTVEVTKNYGGNYSGAVTIPKYVTYNGNEYTVTAIGGYAFYSCSGLTSVTIPNSVTSIGDCAFYGCSGISSVKIPNSVTSIGESAFEECGLTSPVYNNTIFARLPVNYSGSYTVPDGIKIIADLAFYGCNGISSIKIPNSIDSIGDAAFYDCSGLTTPVYNNTIFARLPANYSGSYTIPDGIKTIADYAFVFCHSLTSINIPTSVTSIGWYAFGECSALTSVNIPNGVTTICNGVFYGCSALTSVNIPNSVTSIGESAFQECGLTSPVYNNTIFARLPVNYSGSYTVPDGIKIIAGWAFDGCSHLTSVEIPNSIDSIGERAFRGCSGLTTPVYNNTIFARLPVNYSGSYTIPYGIKTIAGWAFSGCSGLTSITIPDGVTTIGDDAFEDCSGLTSVTIPNSVTTIGESAFYGCSGLTSITIPDGVTSIGDHAFCVCSGLTSVTIPNSVTTIGESAFYGCSGLTSITIPDGVTSIGDHAFYYCSSLNFIEFPNSLIFIGDHVVGQGGNIMVFCNAVTPPNSFGLLCDDYQHAIVYAPCAGLENYKTVEYWNNSDIRGFGNRVSVETNNIKMGYAEVVHPTSCETSVAVIQAIQEKGCCFKQWSDGSTQNPYYVTVDCDTSFIAEFDSIYYTVEVSSENPDHGYVSGGGVYKEDEKVSIAAHPGSGYRFLRWNDGNTQNPRTITVQNDGAFIAEFIRLGYYDIKVNTYNPLYGYVTGSGEYEENKKITIVAHPYEGCRFLRWDDGNTTNPRVITVRCDDTFNASFAEIKYYNINVSSEFPSYGYVSGGGVYKEDEKITITAHPYEGYRFLHWSDGNTQNPRTITVKKDVSLTAKFVSLPTYYVNLESFYHGSVTGGGEYKEGSQIVIEAIPDGGYIFSRWSDGNTDNPRLITVTRDISLTAYFKERNSSKYLVSVKPDDARRGYVTGGGEYDYDSDVQIRAVPLSGYIFSRWNDGITVNPRTLRVRQDIKLTALFSPSTGTDDVAESSVIVAVSGRNIEVYGADGSVVTVFNMQGICIYHGKADSDPTVIPVPASGIYVVKVAGETVKVPVR